MIERLTRYLRAPWKAHGETRERLVAFVAAAPVAYLAVERWLENFAYRVEVEPAVFVLVGSAVVLIAVLTVSYQSVKAATADPVRSLRYE